MANEQNLIPANKLSESEARELGKRGGIKSGKVRREKKTLRETLKMMLQEGLVETIVDVKNEKGEKIGTKTVKITPDLLHGNMVRRAARGDTRAWELVMNNAEGMPAQAVDLTTNGEAINEVEVKIIDTKNEAGNTSN